MKLEDMLKKIVVMQDELGLVSKSIRKDRNEEARRQLAFLIGSANGLYDVLVKDYYDSIRKDVCPVREDIRDTEAETTLL